MKKSYQFVFTRKAESEFLALGRAIQRRIFKKLEFFEGVDDPMGLSVKLSGTKDRFRFRIGDYRIIFTPKDKKTFVILLILKVAHRREVYD